jgi:DNA-binding IclR family transcriptional regulator
MNNTLANGMRVLDALAGRVSASSVTELAHELELPKSHIHRLLQTLLAGGYAVQDSDRRYRVGLGVLRTANAVLENLAVRQFIFPFLRTIGDERGYDSALVGLHGDRAIIIAADYHRGRRKDLKTNVGRELPLHATAAGKALLAQLSGPTRKRLLADYDFAALTPRSITSRSALEREIVQIHADGYAINPGEHLSYVHGAAAPLPLPGPAGGSFAIAVSSSDTDLPADQLPALGAHLAKRMGELIAQWEKSGLSGSRD